MISAEEPCKYVLTAADTTPSRCCQRDHTVTVITASKPKQSEQSQHLIHLYRDNRLFGKNKSSSTIEPSDTIDFSTTIDHSLTIDISNIKTTTRQIFVASLHSIAILKFHQPQSRPPERTQDDEKLEKAAHDAGDSISSDSKHAPEAVDIIEIHKTDKKSHGRILQLLHSAARASPEGLRIPRRQG